MKTLTAITLILGLSTANASIKVIYGEDNRKDVYQVSNAMHLTLAQATAGMIHLGKVAKSPSAGVLDLSNTSTLEAGQNVCPTEAFSQQLTAATCSGFLVGPDTLVTAGHCFKSFETPESVCKSFAWVFDYNMTSETHDPTKDISIKNVYLCKKVVVAKLDSNDDYAVIKLDRKVLGREPLKFRTSGKIADTTSLVVIGHPSGLPTKISDGGKVTRNVENTRFSTTLDTFHGNSGSAVFDSKTGIIEGILIQGKNDYRPSISGNPWSCKVVNKCSDNGTNCSAGQDNGGVMWGEVVLRITQATADINLALKQ